MLRGFNPLLLVITAPNSFASEASTISTISLGNMSAVKGECVSFLVDLNRGLPSFTAGKNVMEFNATPSFVQVGLPPILSEIGTAFQALEGDAVIPPTLTGSGLTKVWGRGQVVNLSRLAMLSIIHAPGCFLMLLSATPLYIGKGVSRPGQVKFSSYLPRSEFVPSHI